MAAQPAAPKPPLRSILRHGHKVGESLPEIAVNASNIGGRDAQLPETDLPRYDRDRSNLAAMASLALCALCGLAVLVSAASFYTTRTAASGDEVTPAVEMATTFPANASGDNVSATPDARVSKVQRARAESLAVTDVDDTADGEWSGENESSMPSDKSEQERTSVLVKHANFS
ncbi:hypothetical protein HPB50_003648 [Hyalomma asiaticum]|uniref:Uncharacterized protein n=1 Tax=Hyalomma asiaticum TaxID=266040 RepID=A0ACB7SEJ6_HYAAI|nr:hypothetical protein HPB50_003648 [Hyalomma asiaticum]